MRRLVVLSLTASGVFLSGCVTGGYFLLLLCFYVYAFMLSLTTGPTRDLDFPKSARLPMRHASKIHASFLLTP